MTLKLLFMSDFLAWHVKFESRKAFKKELNKELMLAVGHANR